MKLLLGISLATLSTLAWAGADCKKHDKKDWIPEADMKKKIQDMGYEIKKFKIDGNCYEIYGYEGKDKDKKKVEIYFDTKTAEIVKKEIED